MTGIAVIMFVFGFLAGFVASQISQAFNRPESKK